MPDQQPMPLARRTPMLDQQTVLKAIEDNDGETFATFMDQAFSWQDAQNAREKEDPDALRPVFYDRWCHHFQKYLIGNILQKNAGGPLRILLDKEVNITTADTPRWHIPFRDELHKYSFLAAATSGNQEMTSTVLDCGTPSRDALKWAIFDTGYNGKLEKLLEVTDHHIMFRDTGFTKNLSLAVEDAQLAANFLSKNTDRPGQDYYTH